MWHEAHIYILRDPDTQKVRYVGCTCKPEQRRHLHEVARAVKRQHPLTIWEMGLKEAGKKPVFEIIVTVVTYAAEYANLASRKAELFWIEHFRLQGDLFNMRSGSQKTDPTQTD